MFRSHTVAGAAPDSPKGPTGFPFHPQHDGCGHLKLARI